MIDPALTPSASKPLRFALVGLGDWAWRHVKLIGEVPEFQLVAVSSRSASAAARAAQELPGIEFHSNYECMFCEVRPDVVVCTTPHYLHAEITLKAIAAGAHVIVEKPMATTLEDARAMVTAARQAGRMLAVFHNRHFDPWLGAAKSAIDRGLLGSLVAITSAWPGRAGSESWRGFKKESGGQLFDLGAHLADYVLSLAGSSPVMVSGHLHRNSSVNQMLNENHASVLLRFENGVVGSIDCSGLDTAEARRFHLVGESGTLVDNWNWNGGSLQVSTLNADGSTTKHELPYGAESDSAGGRPLYQNIAHHLVRGTPLAVPPELAFTLVAILLAAEESSRNGGRWVDLAAFASIQKQI